MSKIERINCKYCNFVTDSFRPKRSIATHTWQKHADIIYVCPGYCSHCGKHCQEKLIDIQEVALNALQQEKGAKE